MKSEMTVVIVGVFLGLSFVRTTSGCPFCFGSQQLTLRERMETPDAALLVEWQSGNAGDIVQEVPASTTFEVLRVWRGEMAAAEPLTIERYQAGQPGDQFLLTGNLLDDVIRWDRSIPLSGAALEYVAGLPSSEASVGDRLRYALRHLESADVTIANDAFTVVAGSKYAEIAVECESLVVADLRRWVFNPDTPVSRRGVYGMLLGLAGSEDDIPRLRETILAVDSNQPIRLGIDGVIGGYLLLSGADGLQELDAALLTADGASMADIGAVMAALDFIWEYGDGVITKSRLRESMRLALQHEPTRELAMTHLARWQDWTATDTLLSLYEDPSTDDFTKRAVVKFLLAATSADREAMSAEEQRAITKAAAALKKLKADDPKIYRRAERAFVPHVG